MRAVRALVGIFALGCFLATLAGVTPIAPVSVASQAAPLAIDDLRLEVGVASPALSPDGRSVVVVTSTANYNDNRFDRTLVRVDIATGARTPLTPSRSSVSQPRWSPSGAYLAFLDIDKTTNASQLYVMPRAGGEASQVTRVKNGVNDAAWTSDSEALLYTTSEVPKERDGEERHNRSFEVGDNSYATRQAPTSVHLWRIPAAGGEPKRLTTGAESIADFAVSPDGRHVAIDFLPRPQTGGGARRLMRMLDLVTGDLRPLPLDGFNFVSVFSPDGRFLAFGRPRGDGPGFYPNGIFVQPAAGGVPVEATKQLDRSVSGVAWLPDGKSFLVTGPDLTQGAMWHQPLDGAARRLDLGDVSPAGAVVAPTGAVAFIGRTPARASEVYVMQAGDWKPKRLTDFNHALTARPLAKAEAVHWDGPDGFKQNGVLLYPPDFKPGRRYPLVLNIHGGPMGTSTDAFDTFNQILAARGWLVFTPNYRGGNGQGKAFQSAVVNDAGDGPARDVMSGIRAVKELGIVDERRVAVSGWSYGGFMTAWLTARYDGWTVAVAGAAVTDWFDWYNMADMNTWAGFGLGGSPWLNDNAANYWRQSPMAYAHKIRTPTLILSDVGDERVTVSQSYKLYHALKDNGVEVQFIAYPVSGHFPPDPVHQRDVRRRWVEWIADHFKQVSGS